MKSTVRLSILLLTVCVLGAGACLYFWHTSQAADRVKMREAYARHISAISQLCSLDIVEDVPVKAHIGTRHFFGRMRLTGSVTFDLEGLTPTERGDTLFISLPPEQVELHESTDPDAYEVIDTWNSRLLGSSLFTAAEENEIKSRVCDSFRRAVYAKGYVKRARAEAAKNLRTMLTTLTGKTVVVTDSIPEGIM
ncbi:MAG: DUF4230 domain-containing protein [Muribaculaceae bacterium]|nr:DUF4230 domain-containing protein [Muribaculaceae bacterium]